MCVPLSACLLSDSPRVLSVAERPPVPCILWQPSIALLLRVPVALGSAGREGAGWLETNAARSEFHKVCKRLDKAKDDAHEHEILHTEVRATAFCGSSGASQVVCRVYKCSV